MFCLLLVVLNTGTINNKKRSFLCNYQTSVAAHSLRFSSYFMIQYVKVRIFLVTAAVSAIQNEIVTKVNGYNKLGLN